MADIAEEKLAVVRDHATLVAGRLDPEAHAIAERVVAERSARLVEPDLDAASALRLRAGGAFQRRNFALAAAAAEAFLGPAAGAREPWSGPRPRRASRAASTWWASGRSWSTTARTTLPAPRRSPSRSAT